MEKAAIADKLGTMLNCKTNELVAKVTEAQTVRTASLSEVAEATISKIPGERIQARIRARLATEVGSFTTAKQVNDLIADELNIIKETAALLQNESGIGSFTGNGFVSGGKGDEFLSDTIRAMQGGRS